MFINLNLQMFAAYTGNATTSPGMSVEMKTFYDKSLLRSAKPRLVHGQFGQKRPIPRRGGKKIEFRKPDSLPKALTPLTEGVTPAGQKIAFTKIEAEVQQYGDFVMLSDQLTLTAIDPIIAETTMMIGDQAGLTIDTVHREILNAGTNVFYAPKKAPDGATTPVTSRMELDKTCLLDLHTIKKATTFLKLQNAMPFSDGYFVGIINPAAEFDLSEDKNWQEWVKYTTPEKMYRGEIGRTSNVRWVSTTEAKVFASNVISTLIMGQNAYGIVDIEGGGMETIVKPLGSAGSADPLNQRSTIGWKCMTPAKILNEAYLVRIESKSTEFDDIAAN